MDGELEPSRALSDTSDDLQQPKEIARENGKASRPLPEQVEVGVAQVETATGRFTRINQRYCDIVGYTRDEMLGLDFQTLTHPDDLQPDLDAMQRLVAGEVTEYARHKRYVRKDGRVVWVNLTVLPLWATGAQPDYHMAVVEDITESRRAEQALRESEERFRTMADGCPIIIWVSDAQGTNRFVNRTYRDFFGVTPEEAEGSNWHPLIHPEDAPEYVGASMRAAREHLPFKAEARVRRADGEWRWIASYALPRWSPGGEFLGHAGTSLDITEQKRAEAEREKLQLQLSESRKMDSVGRLAGGVAHDFNNMLSVILGQAELAMAQVPSTQSLYHRLQEIREAANRSADLTRHLLAFARRQTVVPRVLDLNETVAGILKMMHRLIGENIDIVWRPGANLSPVKMDSSQIDQILANLCVNARDAIGGVGKVTIETANAALDQARCAGHPEFVPGEYVLLTVSDNGCGMDKEMLTHIFEPFFTTKEVGKGTGLGLATVYGIVKQNNGFIDVNSDPGWGTTFKIYLPRYMGKAAHMQKEGPFEPAGRGHETILLVEDEPAILRLGKELLESLGYTVLTASRPGEAIRLAEEYPREIELLMTDVVMPEMNGRDLAKRLLSLCPNLKRLFMSGYTVDVIARQGMLDEGVHFIQKPFSLKALAATVKDALEQK